MDWQKPLEHRHSRRHHASWVVRQNIASLEINGASIGRVPGGIVVTLSVMVDRPDDAIAAGGTRERGAVISGKTIHTIEQRCRKQSGARMN
ncbi:hypothetical protein ACQR0Z_27570 [Bradyrhizobium sp. HKCCYLS3077]|uniref:hypothetical protein n=1 Tax=Bradyrhizobium sp. HKCCYLS3077 TaxID=3420761 RepID=UPI003EBDB8AE